MIAQICGGNLEKHSNNFMAGGYRSLNSICADVDVSDRCELDSPIGLQIRNTVPLFHGSIAHGHGQRRLVCNCTTGRYSAIGGKRSLASGRGIPRKSLLFFAFTGCILQDRHQFAEGLGTSRVEGPGGAADLVGNKSNKCLCLQVQTGIPNRREQLIWNLNFLVWRSAQLLQHSHFLWDGRCLSWSNKSNEENRREKLNRLTLRSEQSTTTTKLWRWNLFANLENFEAFVKLFFFGRVLFPQQRWTAIQQGAEF